MGRHVNWVYLTHLGKSHLIESRKQVQPKIKRKSSAAGRVINTNIGGSKIRQRSDRCADTLSGFI